MSCCNITTTQLPAIPDGGANQILQINADGDAWALASLPDVFGEDFSDPTGNIALTQLPTFVADNANQVLQVDAAGENWTFSQSSAVRFNEVAVTAGDPVLRVGYRI